MDEILNAILANQNLKQGYEVSHNNETGVTTIYHTSASMHPEKSSPVGEGTANIQVTTTTFSIGSDGNLSDVSVNITGLTASVSEERGALGSISYNVDGVEATNEGYSFADANHNSDQLGDFAKDPIVAGVSAIRQSAGDALSSQNVKLPGLKWHDKVQSRAPLGIKIMGIGGGETLGVEDAINFDRDKGTWLSIPQNQATKAAQKMQKLARVPPVILL